MLADVARLRDARPTTTELRQQSQVGDALLRGLIRAQLAHALRVAALLAIGLGSLPLLFAVAPVVALARPFGVGLPWLVLGLAAFPFLFVLGAIYVHVAERTEAEFTGLVSERDERASASPSREREERTPARKHGGVASADISLRPDR